SERLHDRLRAQAAARPDAVALVWKGKRTTYGELDDASDRFARVLADIGCRLGDRVALLAPKKPEAVTALVGIMKTGAAYVPLDPAEPPKRLARLLRSIDCRCILGGGAVAGVLEQAMAASELKRLPVVG